ncbi:MAG: BrnT family toxin [Caldilineaceae bacterium]
MDRYEWDEAKNRANRNKHGISLEEATEILRVIPLAGLIIVMTMENLEKSPLAQSKG